MTPNFKLDYDNLDNACNSLRMAIAVEVAHRGGKLDEDAEYFARVKAVGQWLYTQQTPGLLLCGKVGNGKTTMLDAVINLYSTKPFFHNGIKVGFKRVDALSIQTIYTDNHDEFKDMKVTPMLAIDDMGVEPVASMSYGNFASPIIEILSYRYQHQLLTIIATNLAPNDIKGRYGERIADRFREMMTTVSFKNESYR